MNFSRAINKQPISTKIYFQSSEEWTQKSHVTEYTQTKLANNIDIERFALLEKLFVVLYM